MDISAEIAAIQAASQGSELRQPLVGALNKLNSGSLPAVTASDAGKILKVGANGWEVGEKSGYMPVPIDTINITENDTYDVTNKATAIVNVTTGGITPQDEGKVVSNGVLVSQTSRTINQNGTYDTTLNNELIVDVTGGGSSLPAGYQSIEYIESTGTQYINTGIKQTSNKAEVSAKIMFTGSISGKAAFGGWQNGANPSHAVAIWSDYYFFANNSSAQTSFSQNVIYDILIEYDNGNYNITQNETTLTGTTGNTLNKNVTTFLFAQQNYSGNSAQDYASMRLYRFSWKDNGVLIRDFVPCYRISDGAVGLYDLVTSTFYGNLGNGRFLPGMAA